MCIYIYVYKNINKLFIYIYLYVHPPKETRPASLVVGAAAVHSQAGNLAMVEMMGVTWGSMRVWFTVVYYAL